VQWRTTRSKADHNGNLPLNGFSSFFLLFLIYPPHRSHPQSNCCVCVGFVGGLAADGTKIKKWDVKKKEGGGVGVETNDTRRELWIEFDWSEVEFQTPTPFPPPPSPTCQSPVWLVYHTVHSPEWKGHSQPEYK
jgi:hypothetical protein